MKRIAGEAPPYPEHASLSWPTETAPTTEKDCSGAKIKFSASLQKLSILAQASPEDFVRDVKLTHPAHAKTASSMQSVLWQTLVHNNYHARQIAVIRRRLGAWPPRAGGDTW